MRTRFRRALPADSDFVYKVKKEALGPYIEKTWGWDEDFQIRFHARAYDPQKVCILSTHEEGNVGYVETEIGEDFVSITGIYILERRQNHGIGTAAIKTILVSASKKGLSVKLRVLKENHKARRLYERFGFQLEGETEYHFTMKRSS